MPNAKLTSVSIERFKSHASSTKVDFGLLNILVGRNNSGKSSIIQALLLLKQTLEFPRLDVPLRLEGYVDALSIRELTFGWPEQSEFTPGPSFTLEWESTINVANALAELGWPDIYTLSTKADLPWLLDSAVATATGNFPKISRNRITLNYAEQSGKTILNNISLASTIIFRGEEYVTNFLISRNTEGEFVCYFNDELAHQINVSLEHFIPFISIDRRNVGPRDRQRSWSNAFYILFVESLEDLKSLIKGFMFLSSSRSLPPSLYSPSTEPIDNLGVSGEYAAQLLQSHQSDYVHYLLPQSESADELPVFREQTLVKAVNEVLAAIGVEGTVSIDEIKNAGFRLLFGRANLQHVGRGLTYLLPLIQLGLVSDPLRFKHRPKMTTFEQDDVSYSVCAFEEPEAHLHPKVQSGLAKWLVALAMGRRQIIVETHSDHLVRKLRSIVANSAPKSIMESWLLSNVRLINVEQRDGISQLTSTNLTKEGGLEIWPSDFMDVSTDVEQDIYLASFEKADAIDSTSASVFVHHEAGEPDARDR